MKTINKYVSRDGAEFINEQDALNREHLLDEIDAIERILPAKNTSIHFVNGHGYIQHKRGDILRAREMLVDLASRTVFTEISDYDIRDRKSVV